MRLEKYKAIWKTVREAAHLRREEDPMCADVECNSFLEEEEERNPMDEDETLLEGEVNRRSSTPTRPTEGDGHDEEVTLKRRRSER